MNVHGPNQRSDKFFAKLGSLMGQLPHHRRLLIAGDFNSHLSSVGITVEESTLIGKHTGHDSFNENGQQMRVFLSLHNMAARNTQGVANPSFKVTWTNGRTSSQVDHLLTSIDSQLFLSRMRCVRPEVATDHKALICDILDRKRKISSITPSTAANTNPKQQRLDVAPLKNDVVKKRYQQHLTEASSQPPSDTTIQDSWHRLCEKIRRCARTVLQSKDSIPQDRDCRIALGQVKRYTFRAGRSAHPKWVHKLNEAREELRRRIRDYEEAQIIEFFENLARFPVGERVSKAYRYLKRYKMKKSSRKQPSNIRLTDWEEDSNGPSLIPPLLEEDPSEPLPDPPTLYEIKSIIMRTKNGKTPGLDGIHSEFYKYADEQTLHELHQLLCQIWSENVHPADWKQTVIVPIPKVASPASIDDYRRICLSSAAYKIYAIWVLQKLQQYVGPLGVHQSAFLSGRSTMDHLHILQRILQENWNEGSPLVLMSLDIRKAFDRVSLTSLPAILKRK